MSCNETLELCDEFELKGKLYCNVLKELSITRSGIRATALHRAHSATTTLPTHTASGEARVDGHLRPSTTFADRRLTSVRNMVAALRIEREVAD